LLVLDRLSATNVAGQNQGPQPDPVIARLQGFKPEVYKKVFG
jgi:hypothetical protein